MLCGAPYNRRWYASHPIAARRDKVLRRYGITVEQYKALLKAQGIVTLGDNQKGVERALTYLTKGDQGWKCSPTSES
jgi:hypothetical protein